jgi:hypothetical protein
MNRLSEPTIRPNQAEVAEPKPWWRVDLKPVESLGGPLDPAAPRALWRLVGIGEMAGLLVSTSESVMLDAFQRCGKSRSTIDAELERFKCSRTDLYVLVTLFSAAPRAVPLTVLSRETLADPFRLRTSLDHLDAIGAVSAETKPNQEPAVGLSSSGLSFAVLVTYRVINASNRTVEANVSHPVVVADTRW